MSIEMLELGGLIAALFLLTGLFHRILGPLAQRMAQPRRKAGEAVPGLLRLARGATPPRRSAEDRLGSPA